MSEEEQLQTAVRVLYDFKRKLGQGSTIFDGEHAVILISNDPTLNGMMRALYLEWSKRATIVIEGGTIRTYHDGDKR